MPQATLRFFTECLRATLPEGASVELYHWYNGEPDREIVSEALLCMKHSLPFSAHGKTWRITFCGDDYDEDDFIIEGVEWV